MTTDFRALCAELHAAFTTYAVDECHHNLLEHARAAMAEPKPERPTDEDLLNLHDWMTDEWATNHDFELPPSQYAHAVLARWGNTAPQHNPWKETLLNALVCNFLLNAENEDNPKKALNDLIAWEKQLATDTLINPELQPVPVSERLPEPKDCDAEGRCWVWWKSGVRWVLDEWTHQELREGPLSDYVSHWLPAHALPLPTAND